MKKIIYSIEKYCKKYLQWHKMNIQYKEAQYKKRLFCDAFFAFLYSFISIFLIWIQLADIVVMITNILNMIRSILTTSINASDANKLITIENVNNHSFTYYHIKSAIMITALIFACIILISLLLEFNSLIIKIMTTMIMIIIFMNDCDDIIIQAYHATVA